MPNWLRSSLDRAVERQIDLDGEFPGEKLPRNLWSTLVFSNGSKSSGSTTKL